MFVIKETLPNPKGLAALAPNAPPVAPAPKPVVPVLAVLPKALVPVF